MKKHTAPSTKKTSKTNRNHQRRRTNHGCPTQDTSSTKTPLHSTKQLRMKPLEFVSVSKASSTQNCLSSASKAQPLNTPSTSGTKLINPKKKCQLTFVSTKTSSSNNVAGFSEIEGRHSQSTGTPNSDSLDSQGNVKSKICEHTPSLHLVPLRKSRELDFVVKEPKKQLTSAAKSTLSESNPFEDTESRNHSQLLDKSDTSKHQYTSIVDNSTRQVVKSKQLCQDFKDMDINVTRSWPESSTCATYDIVSNNQRPNSVFSDNTSSLLSPETQADSPKTSSEDSCRSKSKLSLKLNKSNRGTMRKESRISALNNHIKKVQPETSLPSENEITILPETPEKDCPLQFELKPQKDWMRLFEEPFPRRSQRLCTLPVEDPKLHEQLLDNLSPLISCENTRKGKLKGTPSNTTMKNTVHVKDVVKITDDTLNTVKDVEGVVTDDTCNTAHVEGTATDDARNTVEDVVKITDDTCNTVSPNNPRCGSSLEACYSESKAIEPSIGNTATSSGEASVSQEEVSDESTKVPILMQACLEHPNSDDSPVQSISMSTYSVHGNIKGEVIAVCLSQWIVLWIKELGHDWTVLNTWTVDSPEIYQKVQFLPSTSHLVLFAGGSLASSIARIYTWSDNHFQDFKLGYYHLKCEVSFNSMCVLSNPESHSMVIFTAGMARKKPIVSKWNLDASHCKGHATLPVGNRQSSVLMSLSTVDGNSCLLLGLTPDTIILWNYKTCSLLKVIPLPSPRLHSVDYLHVSTEMGLLFLVLVCKTTMLKAKGHGCFILALNPKNNRFQRLCKFSSNPHPDSSVRSGGGCSQYIALGHTNGEVCLWDVVSPDTPGNLPVFQGPVDCITFHPTQPIVAFGGGHKACVHLYSMG